MITVLLEAEENIAYPALGSRTSIGEYIAPHVVVLFGATGDLARRKLLPGLAHLPARRSLPALQDRRHLARRARRRRLPGPCPQLDPRVRHRQVSEQEIERFAPVDSVRPAGRRARGAGADGRATRRPSSARTPAACTTSASRPKAALAVVDMLRTAGLVERSRVIMEKPFGTDLPSASRSTTRSTRPSRSARSSASTTSSARRPALNILAFRFANGLFEPIWNRNHIDHVQIDVPETLGLEPRVGFYESTGAYQGHGRHAPASGARVHGDGAAHRARAPGDQRGEEQGVPLADADRPHAGGARPVRRLPSTSPACDPHSETETFIALQVPDRQLAVGRRAVLPAHRQADGRGRSGSSRSRSARRRRACSRRTPASARRGPTT